MAKQYTIAQGDTLDKIAQSNNTDVGTLTKLNNITDPNKIQAGATLNLPDAAPSLASTGTKAPPGMEYGPDGKLQLIGGASSGISTSDPIRNADTMKQQQQSKQDAEDAATVERLTRKKQIADLQQQIANPPAAPTKPDLVTTYKSLREQYGIDSVEGQINDIKAKKLELQKSLDDFKAGISGVGDTQGFVDAATSEEGKRLQKQLDNLNLQESTLTDQLQTKTNAVSTIMTLTGQDYTNATKEYDTKFSQELQRLTALRGIEQDQVSAADKQADNARATLSVLREAINSGGLNYSSLSPTQKAEIDKLDLAAYGTTGVTKLLKPNEKELDTYTDGNNNRVAVFYDPATKATRRLVLGTAKGESNNATTEKNDIASMSAALSSVSGGDGYVSPTDYAFAKKKWVAAGYPSKKFDETFSIYRNPKNENYNTD